MIPIGRIPHGGARPAAGGAPQPAEAASAAEQAPASGAPQAATAAADESESDSPADSSLPDWSTCSSESEAVTELHEKLREVEEADDISEDVQRELGRILFKKKP